MDNLDVSLIILQITSSNDDAVSALNHLHNEKFRVPTKRIIRRHTRGGTPLVEHHPVSSVLRTDHLPFDPALGFVFGREEEDTDFVLGTLEQGVSQKHFSIDFNWQSKTLLFKNLSSNGTIWTDPETGQNEKITTSRAIIGSKQYRVSAGVVDLILQIPRRDEHQQFRYNAEVQHLCDEAEKATPTIRGLKIQRPGKATPMVIGQKRKYILGRVIGKGATAVVRETIDHETGDRYAAKEYTFEKNVESVSKSMLREISLLRNLKHKHIIQYVDLFKDPFPILIMELALKSLDKFGPLGDGECATLLIHVLDGLAFLHAEEVMHRDIKPANILLTDANLWKLSDFGLSKKSDVTDTFCGSPPYLAPEVDGLAFSSYTKAVDLWSVGAVGVQYSCGFEEGSETLLQGLSERKAWCTAVYQRSKSSKFAPYLAEMLDMVPKNRPPAIQMRQRLERWKSGRVEERPAAALYQQEGDHSLTISRTAYANAGQGSRLSRKRELSIPEGSAV